MFLYDYNPFYGFIFAPTCTNKEKKASQFTSSSPKCRLENEAIQCIYVSKLLKISTQDAYTIPNICMRIKLKTKQAF